MKYSKMAWRNLWRRRRRTIITALSIGFGVMLAVTFTGTGDYAYTNMINTSAIMGLGHISVEPIGYNQTPALDKKFAGAKQIRERVLTIEGVNHAAVRIMGQAMMSSANKTIGGALLAIDPAQELLDKNLFIRSLIAGELFSGTANNGVIVGSKMADKLKIGLGKKLVYTTPDVRGEIVSEVARVAVIYTTGVDEVDGSLILLPIDRVRGILGYGDSDASLIAITVNDYRKTEKIRTTIMADIKNKDVEVLSWRQTQTEMASAIAMDRSSNYVSQVLVGLLIAAGILNTLLMSVLERTREFGIMLALGMSPWGLFRLVLTESFWLAIIGLAVGCLITLPWYLYLFHVGIDFTETLGENYSAGGVLIDPVFKIRLFKESIIAILIGVFSLTLLSGIYPAWRAGRIPPVESLKIM